MNDGKSFPGFDFGEEPLPHKVQQMLEDTLEFHGIFLHLNKTVGLTIFFQGRNRKTKNCCPSQLQKWL